MKGLTKSIILLILRYGRTIGIVILPDGRILNEELLKAGLAWHYKHYDKSEKYAALEDMD